MIEQGGLEVEHDEDGRRRRGRDGDRQNFSMNHGGENGNQAGQHKNCSSRAEEERHATSDEDCEMKRFPEKTFLDQEIARGHGRQGQARGAKIRPRVEWVDPGST